MPPTFEALKQSVEAQIKDERDPTVQVPPGFRDFNIKYVDGDDEQINVSDDEDLVTAYEVANKELNGNLKFIVDFKPVPQQAKKAPTVMEEVKSMVTTIAEQVKEKIEKKAKKAEKTKKEKKVKVAKKKTKGMPADIDELVSQRQSERADTLGQPQVVNEGVGSSSDLDSEDEKGEAVPTGQSFKRNLPPRKALKGLILKELDKIAPNIFESLMKCKELG